MALSCDGAPVTDWTIPWPAVGPYQVDSWETSFTRQDGSRVRAFRVVSKAGRQLHTAQGCVIQFDKAYAEAIAEAANAGALAVDPEPKRSR